MFLTFVYFVSLCCTGIAAGVGVETVLQNGASRSLPAEAYVAMHQQLERMHARVMPIVVNLVLAASVVVAVLERNRPVTLSLALGASGRSWLRLASLFSSSYRLTGRFGAGPPPHRQ